MKKILVGSITGLLSGFFGAGGGAALVLMLQKIFKVEVHKAHATTIAVILPISIVCSFVYIFGVEGIEMMTVIYISAGGVVGGHLGAKYLKKIPGKMLHKIFGVFLIITGLMMIF